VAYHIRQSFPPGKLSPEEALELGQELAMRWTKGRHQFVVAAHTNTNNPHTHIIFNSTDLSHSRKFKNFKFSTFALRKLSDQICLEHGLSIIENPKPSKGWNRAAYLGANKPPTNKERLMDIIDSIIRVGMTFVEFIAALIGAGCEVKQGKKYTTVKIPGAKKNIRLDSIGGDYTEAAIKERLSGKRIVPPRDRKTGSEIETVTPLVMDDAPGTLIDIQAKMTEGKGEGYRQWATIFNLKTSAKTLLFLQTNGIDSYDELLKRCNQVSGEFNTRRKKINEIDSRLKEISELQKQIGTYGKTREVYKQYKESGWSQKYHDQHETDIILHRAAKKHFDKVGLKKLPKMADLKQEYATLAAEKKKLYSGYKELKEQHSAFLNARANTENVLGINKKPTHQLDGSREKSNGYSHEI